MANELTIHDLKSLDTPISEPKKHEKPSFDKKFRYIDPITYAVQNGLCDRSEYQAILAEISERRRVRCNMLVFGVGYDSPLWYVTTFGFGTLIFLEDDPERVKKAKLLPNVLQVSYGTGLEHRADHPADVLFMPLPKEVEETGWDIIFIDGPKQRTVGRMRSFYQAARLAHPGTTVFAHDARSGLTHDLLQRHFPDREIEFVNNLARLVV